MKSIPFSALAFVAVLLASCSAPPSPSASGLRSGDAAVNRNSIDAILNNPKERPGLATGWGDEKQSSISRTGFTRASSKPAGTDVIYYNDKAGISAMGTRLERVAAMQAAAGGLVEWGLKGRGGFLTAYKEFGQGRRLVAANAGGAYAIVVKNRSGRPLEVVASVDGLDVMDGRAASFSKRGYIVSPGRTLEIEGFRTSMERVAAFTFSSVEDSYANRRHGDTRNVGVIGIAVFPPKGPSPWASAPDDADLRNQANPFAAAP